MSERDERVFMYHPDEAPQGRIFPNETAARQAEADGWVDTPEKFPAPDAPAEAEEAKEAKNKGGRPRKAPDAPAEG